MRFRLFSLVQRGKERGEALWIFIIREVEGKSGKVEAEFFLQTPEGKLHVTETTTAERVDEEEEVVGDLIDFDEWEIEEELEESYRRTFEKAVETSPVPSDPDTQDSDTQMSSDAAMLKLRVLEIQRMHLTQEMSRQNTSSDFISSM